MAISHRATGTGVFGVNSITPGIPAGAATGDMMLLLSGGKPYNRGVGANPAGQGWTSLGTFTDGTVAAGVDVGSMIVQAWYKEHDGSEADPTITEGSPTYNVMCGIVIAFQKGAGDTWQAPTMVGGGDASAGTGFSVTAGSDPGVATGDFAVSYAAFRSDAATPCSSHIVATQTGITFSNTHSPATDPEATTGGDMGMCVNYASATGTSSAAPVIAATLAASHTGSAAFVRLRITAAAPQLVTPSTASLTLATFAPTVTATQNQLVTPATAALTLTTFAPTVSAPRVVTPTTAALTLTAFAPTVTASDNQAVTPTTAALTLATFAPTVSITANQTVTPTTASLVTAAFAPTVTVSDNQTVIPTTAALVLTPFAPTVTASDHQTVTPTTAALSLTAFAPDVVLSDHQLVTPTTAVLTLTPFAPTVTAGVDNDITVTPGSVELVLTMFAPTVTASGAPAAVAVHSKRRMRRRNTSRSGGRRSGRTLEELLGVFDETVAEDDDIFALLF